LLRDRLREDRRRGRFARPPALRRRPSAAFGEQTPSAGLTATSPEVNRVAPDPGASARRCSGRAADLVGGESEQPSRAIEIALPTREATRRRSRSISVRRHSSVVTVSRRPGRGRCGAILEPGLNTRFSKF